MYHPFQRQVTLFTRESDEGKARLEAAEFYKKKGNEAVSKADYEVAVHIYNDALKNAVMVHNNAEQVGIIHSNQAFALYKLKRYKEALESASLCVLVRPNWYRGAQRLMEVMSAMGNIEEAFAVGLGRLIASYNNGSMEKGDLEIMKELVPLVPKVTDGYQRLVELPLETEHWKQLIKQYSEENAWSNIRILVLGSDDQEAVVESFDAGGVRLSGLLQTCTDQEWTDWGQRLAARLLQLGADYQSLDSHNKYGLHAAFRKARQTGRYELLKHLFLRHIPSGDVDRVDENGDSVLHLACSQSYPSQETAVSLLLNHKLDPTKKNRQDKYPIQLLSGDSGARTLLARTMGDRGIDSTEFTGTLTTTSRTKQTIQDPKVNNQLVRHSSAVGDWSEANVQSWFNKHSLTTAPFRALAALTGPQLLELRLMQDQAPEFFYNILHKDMKFNLSDILKLSRGLRQLS